MLSDEKIRETDAALDCRQWADQRAGNLMNVTEFVNAKLVGLSKVVNLGMMQMSGERIKRRGQKRAPPMKIGVITD